MESFYVVFLVFFFPLLFSLKYSSHLLPRPSSPTCSFLSTCTFLLPLPKTLPPPPFPPLTSHSSDIPSFSRTRSKSVVVPSPSAYHCFHFGPILPRRSLPLLHSLSTTRHPVLRSASLVFQHNRPTDRQTDGQTGTLYLHLHV